MSVGSDRNRILEWQTGVQAADSQTRRQLMAAQTEDIEKQRQLKVAGLNQGANLQMADMQMKAPLIAAQADKYRTDAMLQPSLTMSQIAQNYGQASAPGLAFDTNMATLGQSQQKIDMMNAPVSVGALDAIRRRTDINFGTGYADGTAKVEPTPAARPKAKASDTVPAKLTPGEAVLNVEAAQLLGEPVIEMLNALGKMRRPAGAGMA